MIQAIKNEYGNEILMKILTNNSTNEIEAIFLALNGRIHQGNKINDVIGMDTTFNICENEFVLSVFIAVNPLYNTSILAVCLMKRETKEYYKFALNSYSEIGYKIPKKVFVDQHAGQLAALIENWENNFNTEIVFCMMHIHRNINQNIGKKIYNNNNLSYNSKGIRRSGHQF